MVGYQQISWTLNSRMTLILFYCFLSPLSPMTPITARAFAPNRLPSGERRAAAGDAGRMPSTQSLSHENTLPDAFSDSNSDSLPALLNTCFVRVGVDFQRCFLLAARSSHARLMMIQFAY